MIRIVTPLLLMLISIVAAPAFAQNQSDKVAELATPRIAIVRVYVKDMDRSINFYRTIFELGESRAYGDNTRVLNFPGESAVLSLSAASEGHANGSFAVAVADIDSVMNRVVEAGGTVTRPASDGKTRIGFITDPDGAEIELIQVPR